MSDLSLRTFANNCRPFPIYVNDVDRGPAFTGSRDVHIINTRVITFPSACNVNIIFGPKHSHINDKHIWTMKMLEQTYVILYHVCSITRCYDKNLFPPMSLHNTWIRSLCSIFTSEMRTKLCDHIVNSTEWLLLPLANCPSVRTKWTCIVCNPSYTQDRSHGHATASRPLAN